MVHHPGPVADDVACRPAVFAVGAHKVAVARLPTGWRWTLTVDGARTDRTYDSQVEAWEAGVREADRLDRLAAAPGP